MFILHLNYHIFSGTQPIVFCNSTKIVCPQISKIRGEGRRKEHGEWKEKFLVKWKQWPFPLWEYYEDIRESKKAYEAFKEAKDRERQREKQEENQPMIIIDSDEEEEGVDNIIFRQIETSIFTKEVHPLTLHLTSITVGRTIRLYEVGMASVLNRGRDESFYSKAKYVDMQYMGADREYLRERSGLSKSDFKGLPGKDWIAGANKFVECKLVEKVYKWLRANIRSGEPLWITIDSDSLALFQMKMRRYQGENQDWAWVVGGFTTWNRIKQLFRMVAPDGAGLIRPDNRSLKQYQEEELKLEHISGTAKDVALNMVTTVEKVALEHFIRHDLEEHFVQRETEKNWNFFANQTCLKGKKLKQHRGLKSFHERVELSDRYNGIYRSWTWDELEDLKRVVRRGNDLLPEKAPRKKVLPEGKWNIINEGRHTICPFNNCGLVQRIGLRRGLGSHLERDHQSESVRPRLCQVCGEIVSISDLETHAAQHSTMNYLMFWVVDKVTKEVVCPECPDLRHLNRFVMLRHMKDKHRWSEWKDPPGGPPLCWLCEEKVPLVDLNKHLHGHELKINFLMD